MCAKCLDHHHRNCTEDLQQQAVDIEMKAIATIANLRKQHNINIFEYGISDGARALHGRYRRPHV